MEPLPFRVAILVGGRSIEHDSSLSMYYHLRETLSRSEPDHPLCVTHIFYETNDGSLFLHYPANNLSLPATEAELRHGLRMERRELPYQLASTGSFLFSVLQGTEVEDGHYQGMMRVLGVGSSFGPVFPAAVSTNKWAFALLAQVLAPETLTPIDTQLVRVGATMEQLEAVVAHFRHRHCVVKPNNLAISFMCRSYPELLPDDLKAHLDAIRDYDDQVLVQERIYGREITCGTLQVDRTLRALPVIALDVPSGILDHQTKFTPSAYTHSFLSDTDELSIRIANVSVRLTASLGFETSCRYDYIISNSGAIHLLEANSKPGLTAHSLYTLMLREAGYSLLDLIRYSALNDAARFKPNTDWRYTV